MGARGRGDSPSMSNLFDLIDEFDQVLDDAVGLYLDSQAGLMRYGAFIEEMLEKSVRESGFTAEYLDDRSLTYGEGDPSDPSALALHSVTHRALKARNAFPGGKNHVLLGQRFIVDIYTFWEDEYRSKIAAALGRDRKTITSDILGDIRLLRISIIHHRGVAKPEVERCKILKWFKEGDRIDISGDDKFKLIVSEIRRWLETFGAEVTGTSPGLLARYSPSGHRRV